MNLERPSGWEVVTFTGFDTGSRLQYGAHRTRQPRACHSVFFDSRPKHPRKSYTLAPPEENAHPFLVHCAKLFSHGFGGAAPITPNRRVSAALSFSA